MMKKTILLLSFACALIACSKIDNYDAPNATLRGEVIDSYTGQPLLSEQPQGFYIRYKELSDKYPDAIYRSFWGKADGSFNNTKLFATTYEVFPYDGAFYQPEAQKVTLESNGTVEVKFSVTPYLAVTESKVEFDQSAKVLHASFVLRRPEQSAAKPAKAFVALTWNPNVSYYCHGDSGISGNLVMRSVSETDLGVRISFDVDCSKLSTGHTWYVRLGCISNKNNNRANYSEVFSFKY